MTDLFYDALLHKYPITPKQFETLNKILKIKSFKKGDLILDIGEIDSQIKFVVSGIVHQYIVVEENLFTINIKIAGMCFNCLRSYKNAIPSCEIQEAVTNVELIYFEKEAFVKLMKQEHWLACMYARCTEEVLLERENRSFLLQHQSAKKRFELFMETNINAQRYLQEVSQKLIAQYLAMAPETYSKVKNAYFKESLSFIS